MAHGLAKAAAGEPRTIAVLVVEAIEEIVERKDDTPSDEDAALV